MTHLARKILFALLLAASAVLVLAATATAAGAKKPAPKAQPCWKTLINDWYDGRIDGTYPIHCYRDALEHLPTDVETYSSARDDIKQALQKRITQGSGGGATTTGGGPGGGGPGGGGPGGGGHGGASGTGGGGSSSGGSGSGGGPGGAASGGAKSAGGPIQDVFNAGKPAKADSVPVPLIVLGAVALLLMAAGAAGFLTRRMRTRRLQLASASTIPQRAGGPPPKQP